MTTRDRRAGHDGKSDTKGESDCNGKQRAEASVRAVDRECSHCPDTREDVEEDACGFSGHLTEPSWACMLESELALGDRLLSDDLAADVSLDRLRYTNLQLVRVQLQMQRSVKLYKVCAFFIVPGEHRCQTCLRRYLVNYDNRTRNEKLIGPRSGSHMQVIYDAMMEPPQNPGSSAAVRPRASPE